MSLQAIPALVAANWRQAPEVESTRLNLWIRRKLAVGEGLSYGVMIDGK